MTAIIRLIVAALLTLMLVSGLGAASTPARADTTVPPPASREPVARPIPRGSQSTSPLVAADAQTDRAIARLNGYRSRLGLAPVSLVGAPGDVVNHAKYLNTNLNVSGLNQYTEEPGLPGYTAGGAAIAPDTETLHVSVGSYSQMVDALMSDPVASSVQLLNPWTNRVAFVRYGEVAVLWFATASSIAPVDLPFVMPAGNNFPLREAHSSVAQWFGQACDLPVGAYGFPITVQWDWSAWDDTYVNKSSLQVNGREVPHCRLSNDLNLGTNAHVVLVPLRPLPAGAHVTGTVSATLWNSDNSASTVANATIDFTTAPGTLKGPGDQNGDGIADILAVTNDGALRLYLGNKPGTLGHGWQIGRGWGTFDWFSRIPDATGDGREDMIGRRSDGHLYLYAGLGMGGYGVGRKVGQNWNGLTNLTVVGDMNGDRLPEVVGIGTGLHAGKLFRYTLTSSGFSAMAQIGRNWGGIRFMAGVGDLDGNKTADIIAVGTNGNLYAYATAAGQVRSSKQIGRGWTGFTALFSPGDLDGDGRPDLVGRNSVGTLYSYQNLLGGWGQARQAGTGWDGIRLFG